MKRPEVVATLTTEVARHELLHYGGGYQIVTTHAGQVVASRSLTTEEAGEWIDTVRRGGGVVHGREVAR